VSDDVLSWQKARKSGTGSCVEMAPMPDGDTVGVRDSKDPSGGMLVLPRGVFRDWVSRAKLGEFDGFLSA
jgi:hypothetical protein